MTTAMHTIEVITLFADNLAETRRFYDRIFGAEILMEDETSTLLGFNGIIVNLVQTEGAKELVEPAPIGRRGDGARFMFTIHVLEIAPVLRDLSAAGVTLLNGPVDRPWGRRTAAFADPEGFVWEIAQDLPVNT